MTEIPPISGWPGKYPAIEPKKKALLVLNDLKELQKDPKLASSHSWITMFAKNAIDLDKAMDQLHHSPKLSKNLSQINNWFKNAREKANSLSELLFELHESHYRSLTALKKFILWLTQKDLNGLEELIRHLKMYIKEN